MQAGDIFTKQYRIIFEWLDLMRKNPIFQAISFLNQRCSALTLHMNAGWGTQNRKWSSHQMNFNALNFNWNFHRNWLYANANAKWLRFFAALLTQVLCRVDSWRKVETKWENWSHLKIRMEATKSIQRWIFVAIIETFLCHQPFHFDQPNNQMLWICAR